MLVCLVDHGAGCEENPDHFILLCLGREVQWGPAGPIWKRDRVASLKPLANTLKITLKCAVVEGLPSVLIHRPSISAPKPTMCTVGGK